jgi:2-dehydro-3-deoxyphosphooctonate aldolase (KDO 8-P synthase)
MKVMEASAEKIRLAGNPNVMVCERGTMHGYSMFFVPLYHSNSF